MLKKSLLILAIASFALILAGYRHTASGETSFQYISHRGGCDELPENTPEALLFALERGFDGVELDVWETDSRELVVFHDSTLERMCQNERYIWEVSSSNRAQYPILWEDAGGNEKELMIPTLAEVFEALSGKDCPIYLHIKVDKDAGHSFTQEAADQVVALLNEYGLTEQTIVFSTHQKAVLGLFLNRGLHLGYITGQTERAVLEERIDWCTQNRVETLILYKMDGIKQKENNAGLVSYCHKRGLSVGVYKVNTQKDEQFLISTGADFSISRNAYFP